MKSPRSSCLGAEAQFRESDRADTELRGAVFEQACAACWKAWQNEQTLVMNHYGLRPHVPADRERLYGLMAEYLKLQPPG